MKNFPVEGGKELVKSFSEFLQSQSPLTNDIIIEFLDTRQGDMTTGVRYPGNKIQVLSSGRLPIDVLRTLSHEWIHEFQTHTGSKFNCSTTSANLVIFSVRSLNVSSDAT